MGMDLFSRHVVGNSDSMTSVPSLSSTCVPSACLHYCSSPPVSETASAPQQQIKKVAAIQWRFCISFPFIERKACGVGGFEIFGLEVILCVGVLLVPVVLLSSLTLLPKELFLFDRQPEKEIKQEQSLTQSSEESLEGIAKELEKEVEQEKMHLLQAKKEKIQQFREEMRLQEEEETQKLYQQKEKSLRYSFAFPVSPP